MRAIDPKAKFKLHKLIKELESYRARHTELVSVYIPSGYSLDKVISQLSQEAGTARNIKSATTRKNVTEALEKMIRHLRIYKRTPANGVAAFSGNVSEREGQSDVKVWSIEPPIELKMRAYKCGQVFFLDPLIDMGLSKDSFLLVVIDRREADIAVLTGKSIKPIKSFSSQVPGKTRAGGQCIKKDTLIQMSDGDIVKIKDVKTPVKCVDFNKFEVSDTHTIDKWKTKKNKTLEIITKNPRMEISCSEDHLLFVRNKNIVQKPASEVKVGDYLIMPEQIDIEGKSHNLENAEFFEYEISKEGRELLKKSRRKKLQREVAKDVGLTQTMISFIEIGKRNSKLKHLKKLLKVLNLDEGEFLAKYCKPISKAILPEELNEELAQIIGYFIGDGNLEPDRLCFSEHREDVANYYFKKCKSFFNANGSLKFRENKGYHQIRIYSRPIVRFMKHYFEKNSESFPRLILTSKNDVVAAFLKGFFDAEGYVSGNRVSLGINDKYLAKQLQLLLLRFGIITSLHRYDNRRNPYSDNTRFTISSCDRKSLVKFKEFIGFTSKEKHEKLKAIIGKTSKTSYSRQIIVDGREVYKIIKKYRLNTQRFPKVLTGGFFRGEKQMSKHFFEKSIINEVSDKKLRQELAKILDYKVLPVKIKEIREKEGEIELIDISTERENFIANGLVVHNSAARFERVREGLAKDFFRKVGETASKEFERMKDVRGILVGGPGPTKEVFIRGNFLSQHFKDHIIGVLDIGYCGEHGLDELVHKASDILHKEEVIKEKKAVEKFFHLLNTNPRHTTYGKVEVKKALEMKAVEIVLISEQVPEPEVEELVVDVESQDGDWMIISKETREGVQLAGLGGVAAILRFPIE